MGLTQSIARAAARSAHVLVVEVPGYWQTRSTVERAVLGRGWSLAFSPADADVLAVCGDPGPRLAEAVDSVWHQMPGPRVRVDVHSHDDAASLLEGAFAGLLDTEQHRRDAATRPIASDLLDRRTGHTAHGDEDHGHGSGDGHHEGDGHEEMGHGDDGGHDDHGGHDHMQVAPAGIPLAEGGEDRDGLELDVLNVRLGPVLPHWPAGLVVRCSLLGDVIADADAAMLDPQHRRTGPAVETGPARTLDNIASILALAGWHGPAAEARRICHELLEAGPDGADGTVERLRKLHRRVGRSWVLRWSLRNVRPLSSQALERLELPEHTEGDTYDRLLRMFDRASARDGTTPSFPVSRVSRLVQGLDLATARLVVASLDLRELHVDNGHHEAAHV